MLKSLHRLFQCRLDRSLERRLPGFNLAGKSLPKHADGTELVLARRRKLRAAGATNPYFALLQIRPEVDEDVAAKNDLHLPEDVVRNEIVLKK